jgi:hypothetical protein
VIDLKKIPEEEKTPLVTELLQTIERQNAKSAAALAVMMADAVVIRLSA